MKQKQSEKIADAIVEAILGPQPSLSGVHPLHKSPCGFCGAMVCEKDMQNHLGTLHGEFAPVVVNDEDAEGDRGPEDNEVVHERSESEEYLIK